MIVDFHTHIVPPEIKERRDDLVRQDPCFQALYSDPKVNLATAEDLIASMDREAINVSVALNIGWSSPELCRRTNDYIMESISRYPDRLVGFCSLQPKSREAVSEIERCARGGIRGIGELMPHMQGFDLGDKALMSPVVEAAQEHNMILLTHSSEPIGHIYPGKGDVLPETLYRFITNFPDLLIVCAHWGGGLPFYALMPEVARALQNVFYDTAASPFLYRYEIFPCVAELIGEDRILFGSDYPLITQSRIVESLRSLSMSQETKDKILGENARRLLGLS
ncbi:amidohydrolase family protein [Dehalococcoidia bacterium]|nr:amidohydrolase family protein [Dehalococcoidia bacterium]